MGIFSIILIHAITEGINTWKKIYNARGFYIVAFCGDNKFEKVRHEMLPATLHVTALGEHIPEVKRSVHTIKEGCMSGIHGSPYAHFPWCMLRALVRNVDMYFNTFPSKHSISTTLTPWNITGGLQHLDYNMKKLVFGSYVQLSIDDIVTNTTKPWIIGATIFAPKGTNRNDNLLLLEMGREAW